MPRKTAPLNAEEKADLAYQAWLARLETLHAVAGRAYKRQNKLTQEALDVTADRLFSISQGLVKFHGVIRTVPPTTLRKNALYLATEIFKDLALLDIRVADFEFVDEVCVECGAPVGKVSKKKGGKK